MHLTQVDTVSDAIYEHGRRKYIRLENIKVLEDDGTLPSIDPHTYMNQPVHRRIRDIIQPTDDMKRILDEHNYLVKDVAYALQIRRCGLVKDQTIFKEHIPNGDFCTDATLEIFYNIVENVPGNVFVTSDCRDVKREFLKRWPDRVRILDAHSVHTSSMNGDIDPMVPFLDFFLLSQCPFIFVTGGDPRTGMSISTFGYMAAVYGNKGYRFIFNQ
jgi:hypothetical protein